jgi:iron complex outermembrane receptor protein
MDESYDVGQSADVASYDAGPHALQDPYGFCTTEADMAMRTPTAVAGGGVFTSSIGGMAAVAGNTVAGLDCTSASDPVYRVVGVGANGFPGYSPAFSEKYQRDSYAVYGDLSADVNDRLYLQAAVRFEDYSDFGNETVGKIAGRVRVSDQFAIRGSIGTGFRAPTPGQQGTTNVSTRLPNGFPVATGLFPASGPIAQALGAVPLKAETSQSYTLGFTADLEAVTLTVDFYHIDIDDRFSAISTLDVSTDPASGDAYDNYLALKSAGVSGAESIGGVFYFANAFDSSTEGVDVVASMPIDWGNGQDTNLNFAMNWNKSKLESDASDFLNAEDQFDFEHINPQFRWNLTANHSFNEKFSTMVRGSYYGQFQNSNGSNAEFHQDYGSTFFVDLEASYAFNDNWSFSLGGRNILDQYPDQIARHVDNNDYCCGRVYNSTAVVPWQGGYYYGALRVNF